ncbi:Aste57867_16387 [Aphanomyces stellatus]|uniref:Aste57867_16387 protein n=1 Tax=Aphanomyces stellatus TaxID=120398 RepID=A0A485L6K2_9STRA|nr:hypothetical protein As57867_016330 [Aphanomyces stellatus]VFT93163.1 Aste57867_16387 [Aphanomyces stellatus]
MDDHLELYLLANRTVVDDSHGKKEKYTVYTIYIKNLSTSQKYSVQRRYSDFYELRTQLLAVVAGHCGICHHLCTVLKSYPFPGRTPLSWSLSVVQERIDGLGLFLKDILRDLLALGAYRSCPHTDASLRQIVLRRFLEVDEVQLAKRVPKPVVLSDEAARFAARTRSFQRTTPTPDDTPKRRVVDADTCPSCLSKWTDCYCQDDEMFSGQQRIEYAAAAAAHV